MCANESGVIAKLTAVIERLQAANASLWARVAKLGGKSSSGKAMAGTGEPKYSLLYFTAKRSHGYCWHHR